MGTQFILSFVYVFVCVCVCVCGGGGGGGVCGCVCVCTRMRTCMCSFIIYFNTDKSKVPVFEKGGFLEYTRNGWSVETV